MTLPKSMTAGAAGHLSPRRLRKQKSDLLEDVDEEELKVQEIDKLISSTEEETASLREQEEVPDSRLLSCPE
jgi:hypothetical protein